MINYCITRFCSLQLPSCQNNHKEPSKAGLTWTWPRGLEEVLAVPLWTRWGECSWSGILAPWRLCISAREVLWIINKSRALETDSCQLVMHLVHNCCSETGPRNATALWDHARGLLKSGSYNWHQQLDLDSYTLKDLGHTSLESFKDSQLFRENCKFALSRKASYTIKRTR